MKAYLLASAALAAMNFGMMSAAFAQDTNARAEVSERRDDIVVTGQRPGLNAVATGGALGDRSILDTPFSVTVVDAEEITARQPASMAQLFENDPGIFSFASAGTVNWWGTQIRGLPVRNYYIDDTALTLYWGGDYPLEGIESVQALKGATGFMYGFGSPGGAISYRTKRPTDVSMLTTDIGFRGHSAFSGHLDAGGPVGNTGIVGYRLNLAVEDGEEYNTSEIERGLGSFAFDVDIAPNLVLRTNAAYEDYGIVGEPFHVYLLTDALPSVPDNWDDLNVDNSSYRYTLWSATTALDWQIDDAWSASLMHGFTYKRHRADKTFIELLNQDGDYTLYRYQFGERDIANFTQGLLQGDITTGTVRHELVAGASYQVVQSNFGDAYNYEIVGDGNIFEPQPYLIPNAPNVGFDSIPYVERQTSVFLSDTLHLGEHWQALIGLRQNYYDIEDRDDDPLTASGYTATEMTPTLALIYKPVDHATLYVSYVESLESGGRVTDPLYLNVGELLEATVSTQYEAGFKYESGRVSLTGAVFRIERVEAIDEERDDGLYLVQDGLTLYEGVELIGEMRVTEDLTLGLGVVHLDASIEDVSPFNTDIEGNRPSEVAEWQFVANVSYDVPTVRGLTLHGNVRHYGDAPVDTSNALIVPEYTLVNAGFSYAFHVGGQDAQLIGNLNNVLDERYWGLQNFGETINGSLGLVVNW